MNDEENKAIKIAKGITEDDLLNYWEGPEEPYNAIQTILNLIEKQSKEIEELKDMKKELTERVLRLESDKFWDNVVSKAKIKAKIEEITEEKEHYLEMNDEYNVQICDCIIEEYKSLLEKE